jgi:formylglycine-generating enzyme required for sulfatase activity
MPSYLQTEPAFQLDLGNGIEMSFQLIEAGSFLMGSRGEYQDEEPRHLVRISNPLLSQLP